MVLHYFKLNPRVMEAKGRIPFWVIAQRLGVHENTVRNWMKSKMSEDKEAKVLAAIEDIKKQLAAIQ